MDYPPICRCLALQDLASVRPRTSSGGERNRSLPIWWRARHGRCRLTNPCFQTLEALPSTQQRTPDDSYMPLGSRTVSKKPSGYKNYSRHFGFPVGFPRPTSPGEVLIAWAVSPKESASDAIPGYRRRLSCCHPVRSPIVQNRWFQETVSTLRIVQR